MPSTEAWARCATEKASLTKMSPSAASCATKAGSLRSSPEWNRVFSRHRMSPGFMAFTSAAARSPMQSSANATGRLRMAAIAGVSSLSDCAGSGPLGRPKWESRITLPPLSAISQMVGATRSMRVVYVTLPFSTGTLRSTRTSTRFPLTSAWSRVRNMSARPSDGATSNRRNATIAHRPAKSDQLAHRHRGVDHPVGEAPFVVVPRHHAHQRAVHHLGLIHRENGRVRIVIEIAGDVRRLGIAEDTLELLLGGALHRAVDFVLCGRALGDELEVDNRHVGRGHPDRHAVELAGKLRQHQPDGFGRPGGGRDQIYRRGARAIEIFVHLVERGLVVGVGMHRSHAAFVDADGVVEHFGNRRQAVGGA